MGNLTISLLRTVALMAIILDIAAAELIFRDNFDEQEDWHSGLMENDTGAYLDDQLYDGVNSATRVDMYQRTSTGHTLPQGWTSVRQGEQFFSPRNGYSNSRENIEILSSNSDMALGRQGKSAVFWRESHQLNSHQWNSDGILMKIFPEGYDELYVEFWITFDDNTTLNSWELAPSKQVDVSKIFRMLSIKPGANEYSYFNGEIGPMFLWDWKVDPWGVRNVIGTSAGPYETLKFEGDDLADMPPGGGSKSYLTGVVEQGLNGETEWPIDMVNGGLIKDNSPSGIATHEQVFGKSDQWVKMAFYVKMNSSPGEKDGHLVQWINGRRIINVNTIPWSKENSENIVAKWNAFALGGNDYFHSHPLSQAREEWFAIDNLKVYSTIPDFADIDLDYKLPPAPPENLIYN